jgi:hypothetical protein
MESESLSYEPDLIATLVSEIFDRVYLDRVRNIPGTLVMLQMVV